ncbi:MAG TPA: DUF6691 family protein [Planctomycetota bacterium]|nr:DUF6691 family protein [Planctomycetota bacterium]
MKIVVAFVSGLVFALGLGRSGMLLPGKVLGFLDVAGRWDPALLFVMGPAAGLTMAAWLWRKGRPTPWGGEIPRRSLHALDARLFLGAGLFGIGWGLTGVCPGPAVSNLAAPSAFTLTALGAMIAGILLSLLPLFQRRGPGH